MNTTSVGNTFSVGRAYENETLKVSATNHLDDINDLRRAAAERYAATIGKIGEAEAFQLAMDLSKQYEIAMQAYAAIGLTDLGIHNVKSYANAKVGA